MGYGRYFLFRSRQKSKKKIRKFLFDFGSRLNLAADQQAVCEYCQFPTGLNEMRSMTASVYSPKMPESSPSPATIRML